MPALGPLVSPQVRDLALETAWAPGGFASWGKCLCQVQKCLRPGEFAFWWERVVHGFPSIMYFLLGTSGVTAITHFTDEKLDEGGEKHLAHTQAARKWL